MNRKKKEKWKENSKKRIKHLKNKIKYIRQLMQEYQKILIDNAIKLIQEEYLAWKAAGGGKKKKKKK